MWHRLAHIDDIPPGTGREFAVGDRIVAVFNVEGTFYALDGICPHAGGPLGEGELRGGIVTCPWHGWQFEVATGKHCLSSQIRQTCFNIQVEGQDIFVEVP